MALDRVQNKATRFAHITKTRPVRHLLREESYHEYVLYSKRTLGIARGSL
jgi:hypothetical protein